MVDASCGGTFMLKSKNEEWTLFENLDENSIHHASSSCRMPAHRAPKTEGLFEVSNQVDVTTKVDTLSRKIDQLMAAGFAPTTALHMTMQHEACSFCCSPSHHAKDCPTIEFVFDISHEQVNAAFSTLGNDPY
jgi:hypothetical protein